MRTKIKKPTKRNLKLAANLIKNEELVAFPTETVYGLGANALSKNAVKKIFKAKNRPANNPLIVHISNFKMLPLVTSNLASNVTRAMKHFWPGPVTFIVPKTKNVPLITTGKLNTVAIRMPSSKIALKLIERSKVPIAAPSANTSGRPSPTTALEVFEDLNRKIPLILNGGKCKFGVESTVIELKGKTAVIHRLGALSIEKLKKYFKRVLIAKGKTVKSPGVKYKHYSPSVPVIFITGNKKKQKIQKELKKLRKLKKNAVVLSAKVFKVNCKVEKIGKNSQSAARALYSKLRKAEKKFDVILVTEIKRGKLSLTFNERAQKAASKII